MIGARRMVPTLCVLTGESHMWRVLLQVETTETTSRESISSYIADNDTPIFKLPLT